MGERSVAYGNRPPISSAGDHLVLDGVRTPHTTIIFRALVRCERCANFEDDEVAYRPRDGKFILSPRRAHDPKMGDLWVEGRGPGELAPLCESCALQAAQAARKRQLVKERPPALARLAAARERVAAVEQELDQNEGLIAKGGGRESDRAYAAARVKELKALLEGARELVTRREADLEAINVELEVG